MIKISNQDLKNVFLGGAQAKRVMCGSVVVWESAPETHVFDASSSLSIPNHISYVDVIATGGGASGLSGGPGYYAGYPNQTYYPGTAGYGGKAGQWSAKTFVLDNYAQRADTISVIVGAGGGPNTSATKVNAGGNSAITFYDYQGHPLMDATLNALGGSGNNKRNDANGDTASNLSWNGTTYTGGAGGIYASATPGSSPGGGGSGGSGQVYFIDATPGNAGGAGRVYVVFRSY